MIRVKNVILLVLMGAGSAKAYLYEIKVMRLRNPSLKQLPEYFIGCSDFHDKTSRATMQQLVHLENVLQRFEKKSVKVLLEDLSSCGSNGRLSCGRYFINSRGGVLGGLAQKCRALGFDVDNVEYRYCRVSAIGPVLNNLQKKPHMFPSVVGTSLHALATEIDVVMQEVQAYADGDALQPHYQQAISQVQEHLSTMTAPQCQHMNVADYLEHHSTPETRLELVKHLLTFDSCLLDLKMAHAVVNAQASKVLAIAGGAHIARVSEMLEKVGYETVYETDVAFRHEYDLSKCLGSTVIDGAYCVRPEPIDLNVLQKYVD